MIFMVLRYPLSKLTDKEISSGLEIYSAIRICKVHFLPACNELHGRPGNTCLREGALPSIPPPNGKNHFGKAASSFEYKFVYFEVSYLVRMPGTCHARIRLNFCDICIGV